MPKSVKHSVQPFNLQNSLAFLYRRHKSWFTKLTPGWAPRPDPGTDRCTGQSTPKADQNTNFVQYSASVWQKCIFILGLQINDVTTYFLSFCLNEVKSIGKLFSDLLINKTKCVHKQFVDDKFEKVCKANIC